MEAFDNIQRAFTGEYRFGYSEVFEPSLEFNFDVISFTGEPIVNVSLLSADGEELTSPSVNALGGLTRLYLDFYPPSDETPVESYFYEYVVDVSIERFC